MKTSGAVVITTLLVLIISLVSIWFFPSVQDFMATNSMWNGIQDFRDKSGAVLTDSLDNLPGQSENFILVEIPYLAYSNRDMADLKQFIDHGGTLLLMDDFGYGNEVLEYLGLKALFSRSPLLDPLFNYRNQFFPRITDFNSDIKKSLITVVVLNHATALTGVNTTEQIAWSSPTSYLDINDNGKQDAREPKGPLPVAAVLNSGKGIIYAVADPSIIIGGMINRDDNYKFLEFITAKAGKQRQILFDTSHLAKTPLDVSKTRLLDARAVLSSPYILTVIVALIFVLVPWQLMTGRKTAR